jgi:hypothetical protein
LKIAVVALKHLKEKPTMIGNRRWLKQAIVSSCEWRANLGTHFVMAAALEKGTWAPIKIIVSGVIQYTLQIILYIGRSDFFTLKHTCGKYCIVLSCSFHVPFLV